MSTCTRQPFAAGSLIRDTQGRYIVQGLLTDHDVLSAAEAILLERCHRLGVMNNIATVKQYLKARLGTIDCERFEVLWLDGQHRLMAIETLASGTIDSAMVYPRVVVQAAIRCGAAAVLFAHNHPSGVAEPSAVDRAMTDRLKQALALIDVRVLDHFVVGAESCTSFAERGWI
jgi:DNA repair protein RadC